MSLFFCFNQNSSSHWDLLSKVKSKRSVSLFLESWQNSRKIFQKDFSFGRIKKHIFLNLPFSALKSLQKFEVLYLCFWPEKFLKDVKSHVECTAYFFTLLLTQAFFKQKQQNEQRNGGSLSQKIFLQHFHFVEYCLFLKIMRKVITFLFFTVISDRSSHSDRYLMFELNMKWFDLENKTQYSLNLKTTCLRGIYILKTRMFDRSSHSGRHFRLKIEYISYI